MGVALQDFGDDLAQALSGKELRHYNHALLEALKLLSNPSMTTSIVHLWLAL